MVLEERRMDNQLSVARLKMGDELSKIVEIKKLQKLDNRENNQRDKMIMIMKHQAYQDDQRKKELNFA